MWVPYHSHASTYHPKTPCSIIKATTPKPLNSLQDHSTEPLKEPLKEP